MLANRYATVNSTSVKTLTLKESDILYNLLIPLFSAFLGGYFSVYVFEKGLREQKKTERRKRREDNLETEEYFKLNLKSLIYSMDQQIEELVKAANLTKDWYAKSLGLYIVPDLKLTEIRELDFKSLFQIFVINRDGDVKEKSEDFINIKNCFHHIESFISHHQNENTILYNDLNRESDLWNENAKNLLQLYNKYTMEKYEPGDELILLLNSKLVIKQREIIKAGKAQNLDLLFEEVINPIIIDIQKLPNKKDLRVHPIVENLILCRKAYESIVRYKFERRKTLLKSARRLLAVRQLLNKSLNSIESRFQRD